VEFEAVVNYIVSKGCHRSCASNCNGRVTIQDHVSPLGKVTVPTKFSPPVFEVLICE
jgi:hypothetical protein